MEQKYKTTLATVAFIDVLGSSEAIKSNANESLNAIHTAYDETIIQFEKYNSEHLNEPKVDIFSDNIILSNEIIEGKEERAFFSIIFFSALLQLNMWINDLLVRGGISYEDFFSDERMIWGNALIRAYKLEGQIAIYPRIIVEPEMAEIINPMVKPERGRLLCEDFDGIYFVDPFGIKQKDIGLYLIEQFIDDNTIRLRNSQGNLKVYQKINWLQQYFCEKHREMIDAQKIKTYECQGSCAKILQ